ncbi:MAG: diaminopimelate epimerase [Nitrospiraceae bacterium]|jgi:diaminopimelate epimerase|uniref:diaminopimelate epimerase n=1 Tax=Nitrospira cf. moscoviensis SBR1015 TaxID=96242 RepID=UPI000A09A2A1|nr:diaminopimelate epimerase [Nitrospira cf. moscoviensis SBR1015]MBY0248569.1 diaminopimelate epimerase [Nitrospiraceae bacterium]OQW35605.1 MAG: diaminopimelate epimerase [Nitrospira sp. SG-bin2]
MKNGFFRGHGLGNDYVVMDPKELSFKLTPKTIKAICDRNWGLGSDGILALVPSRKADFGLRIFNPDGSEAEKSGNGLRIFARYLHATGKTKKTHFTVETKGGLVTIDLHLDRHRDAGAATVEMGHATFKPAALPCTLNVPELIQQPIDAAGRSLTFTGVSVGNPHCVVFKQAGESWSREELLILGPALENHNLFPKRTNVQLAVPTGPKEIFILIWERGAGETQASGSSSCAAACAAVRLGLVKSPVTVKMPGGTLNIDVAADFNLTMKGPVAEVARGTLSPSFVRSLR